MIVKVSPAVHEQIRVLAQRCSIMTLDGSVFDEAMWLSGLREMFGELVYDEMRMARTVALSVDVGVQTVEAYSQRSLADPPIIPYDR